MHYRIVTDSANKITFDINSVNDRIIIRCTNQFEEVNLTLYKPSCTNPLNSDLFAWFIKHLSLVEQFEEPWNYPGLCECPPSWSCAICFTTCKVVSKSLRKWLGEAEYQEFLRAPLVM